MRRDKRHAAVAAAIAAVATALIVVSACFLFAPVGEGGLEGLFATTVEAASNEGAQPGDVRAAGDADAEDADAEDADGAFPGAAGNASGSATGSPNASQGDGLDAGGSPASSGASSQNGSGPAPSAGAAGGASSASADSSTGGSAASGVPQTVTVSVTVSSSAVGGSVSGGARPTFAQGATAYDALCAVGLSVNAERTSYGIYVTSVGGLAQKEHGGKSGWMYSVNGMVPMTSCGNYVLRDGDDVQWYYVV